jgi:hypothetical protein
MAKAPQLADTRTPYEVLIRYGVEGKPVGAHVQYLRRVTLGDEVLKEEVESASAVTLDDLPLLIDKAAADALIQVTRLNEDKAQLAEEIRQRDLQIVELVGFAEAMQAHAAEVAPVGEETST